MHHGVAMGDIDIELVERLAAEVFEVLLYLHFDIGPCKIGAKQITIDGGIRRIQSTEKSSPT